MQAPRAIVLVLDGCGAGEAPDAGSFGDSDHPATIAHVVQACQRDSAIGLPGSAPNLSAVGFFAACHAGPPPTGSVLGTLALGARYGRLQELSAGGKDSVTGHWEMMGVITERPFPTYPNGFPLPLIKQFERRIGTQTLGNRAASGTEIIAQLGELHIETGFPIVYTSADSVFQIACHEAVVPLPDLYRLCEIARELCVGENAVQRVIARPFVGDPATGFTRTGGRRDLPLPPPANLASEIGDVYGIGVVPELFAGTGFREVRRTTENQEHWEELWQALESDARFIFANFEDFDMRFGHRNDPAGFGKALQDFDAPFGSLLRRLQPSDLLLLTADHGNDPTTPGTDHSREFVPACVIGKGLQTHDFGDVLGFTAIGATVAAHLGVTWSRGRSLLLSPAGA